MRRRLIPDDEWQYRERSSREVRTTLLELTVEFLSSARICPGVTRLALVGSILTSKPRPKDVDVLVTVSPTVDLLRLAQLGRRLKGGAQTKLNSGADVFLADEAGRYIGRICEFRECHPRARCSARHCTAVPHLNDDLDVVCLDDALIATPPVELWPAIVTRVPVPDDVDRVLLASMREQSAIDVGRR